MKINFGIELKAINGEPLLDAESKEAKVITLGVVTTNALLAPVQEDSGVQKAKKYKLAIKTVDEKELDLEAEDIAMIKECIGKGYAPLVVGQCFDILDNKE